MPAKTISMRRVESSQIHSIGHDPETNTLAIRFKDRVSGDPRALYHYRNFTAEDFKAFNEAESFGSYFYKHIKSEVLKFPYTKIDESSSKAA